MPSDAVETLEEFLKYDDIDDWVHTAIREVAGGSDD